MPKMISSYAVIAILRAAISCAGSQQAFAQKHGVSESYVCDVLHGRREPAGLICTALGIERVTMYRRIEGGSL